MMKRQIGLILIVAALALNTGCSVMKTGRTKAEAGQGVAELVAKMPAASSAEAEKLSAGLVALGADEIEAVCGMLAPWSGKDEKAQFALGGLTVYAARPGGEADRKLVAGAYLDALKAAKEHELKTFLIRQLERVGRDEAVRPLGRLLADEKLCAPAAQALVAIGTPRAETALRRELGRVKTAEQRVAIIQGLGTLRVKDAADQILQEAASEDAAVRQEALWALANLGEPRAEELLARAVRESKGVERDKAVSNGLLYARRLADHGQAETSAKICREIMNEEKPGYQCAALATLAQTQGNKAGDDLLKAMERDSKELRAAALKIAVKMPGEDVTGAWIKKMETAGSPEVRGEILRMLGERGDRAALPAIVEELEAKDEGVRLAAIGAAGKMGGPEAAKALVSLMQGGANPGELDAVKGVLLRMTGKDYQEAMVKAYPQATAQGKVRILELLGARQATDTRELCFGAAGESDETVRLAALKALREIATEQDLERTVGLMLAAKSGAETTAARNAVTGCLERCTDRKVAAVRLMKVYAEAGNTQKPMLLGILPQLGGPGALQLVQNEAKAGETAVRAAAIRAMADWPDANPMSALFSLASGTKDQRLRTIAFRGYVRMIGLQQGLSDKEKAGLCKQAMAAAPSRDEIRPVLAVLGGLASPEAFRAAAGCLEQPELKAEATLAVVNIAEKVGKQIPNEVKPVLQKIVKEGGNAALRKKAQGVLNGVASSK